MVEKLKVMTVVGTRPELIRLSRVIDKLDMYFKHTLVHTGQNYDYELQDIFHEEMGIRKADHVLSVAGASGSQTVGNVIAAVDQLLEEVNPEALLVLGDTNSCLAVYPAKRRKIPTFHMEAGNRCFDMRVPEEINRRLVDHIADVNITYSSIARDYLLREGLPPDRIIKLGSPLREVIEHYRDKIENSNILSTFNLAPGQFFLVSVHREENVEDDYKFNAFLDILERISLNYKVPLLVSTHPRTRKRLVEHDIQSSPLIRFLKPLGFFDYCKLQLSARVVLSDSGTITEESSIMRFPALNLREVHERPEGMEQASVMMVGLNVDSVLQGIEIIEKEKALSARFTPAIDYEAENISDKMVRIIHSYRHYVMRTVWKQY